MDSVSKKPDDRIVRYATYYTLRLKGASGDQITDSFSCAPRELYERLFQDGFPVCRTCGETPAKESHCEAPKKPRKAKRSGEGVELPPAGTAAEIFAPVIDALDLVDLSTLREVYRGERFEAAETYDMAVLVDMVEGTKTFGAITAPLGATQIPPRLLTQLISAYVIAGEPIDRLLETLHPNYSDLSREDKAKIKEKADKLALLAGHTATLVRGGGVRTGHHTGELTPKEQAAAEYITRKLKARVPEPEIAQTLKERGFKESDIRRLKKLRIDYPGV